MAALRSLDIEHSTPAELSRLARGTASLRAALDGLDARLASAMADADGEGASSRLRGATRRTQREADRAVERGRLVADLPAVGEALARGEISAGHVDLLARTAERTSATAVIDGGLLEVARRKPADAMRREVNEVVRAASDGDLVERQRRARAARRCVIFDDETTGMTVLHAEFDPVAGARVRSALASATESLFVADGGRDAAREVRAPQQRRADALQRLVTEGSACRGGPPSVRDQMIIVVSDDGSGRLAGGGQIPASEVERLACGSELRGLVLRAEGEPLWLGRRRRLVSDAQWFALIVRDGGCIACDADPSRCEAHHVRWHRDGGSTDIDNLVLLCGHHHHLVHDRGWRVSRDSRSAWSLAPP